MGIIIFLKDVKNILQNISTGSYVYYFFFQTPCTVSDVTPLEKPQTKSLVIIFSSKS